MSHIPTHEQLERHNRELAAALRMVLENTGSHQHWDSFGTEANCPICKQQQEAQLQAWEVLRAYWCERSNEQ